MRRNNDRRKLAAISALLFSLGACVDDTKPQPVKAPSSAPLVVPTSSPTDPVADCTPLAELAAMDNRTPVPLQPMMAWHQKRNMMDHLVAIQGITAALADDDWEAIAKASKPIESSPQMAQMCQHMGSGAAGFTALALDFHKRADGIAIAAKAKDHKGVLKATSLTLQACTTCHATYKQDVVSASVWEKRTGTEHVPTMKLEK